MDDILDNLGPIVIGVLYLLGWLFNKKNKDDEDSADPLQDLDFEAEQEKYQRHVQARNNSQQIAETTRQTPATPVPNLNKQHQHTEVQDSKDFSWDQSDDSYDQEMEAQLKKIEATKREAARLLSQSTEKRTQAQTEISNPKTTRKTHSFGSVKSSLKDPKAARSAFIYAEVLGPPVSLRKGSEVPGLTSS